MANLIESKGNYAEGAKVGLGEGWGNEPGRRGCREREGAYASPDPWLMHRSPAEGSRVR